MQNDKNSNSIAVKEKDIDNEVESNVDSYKTYFNSSIINSLNKLAHTINANKVPIYNLSKILTKEMELIREPLMKLQNSLVSVSKPLLQTQKMLELYAEPIRRMPMSIINSMPTIDYLKNLNMVNNQTFQIVQNIYQMELNYLDRIDFKPILYNNIANILSNYSELINKNFFSHIITKPIFEDYIALQENLAFKINRLSSTKIEELSNFYANYTTKIIDFQVNVIDEFKSIGVIEERAINPINNNEPEIKAYNKVSQSLSVAYRNDTEKSTIDIYKDSFISLTRKKAECIVGHVLNINKMSQLSGQALIKPTVDTMDICCNMPNLFANTESDFKSLIDWLYKLLWENKQRLESYLTAGDLDFINNLRRYYYHDLEHGDKKDYQKKFSTVKDFFQNACGCKYPTTSKEWLQAQQHIYDKLDTILAKVKSLI